MLSATLFLKFDGQGLISKQRTSNVSVRKKNAKIYDGFAEK